MAKWRKAVGTAGRWLWNTLRVVLFTVFAVVCAVGLWHSWTAKGSVDDRRAELARLQEQLLEQQMRGEELQSRLGAFAKRPDVRRQTIRAELGMLGENERFYVFK